MIRFECQKKNTFFYIDKGLDCSVDKWVELKDIFLKRYLGERINRKIGHCMQGRGELRVITSFQQGFLGNTIAESGNTKGSGLQFGTF